MAKGKIHISYGWWILLVGFILMFCGHGARNSPGVFLRPIEEEFGGGLAQILVSISISNLLGFIVGLASAPFIDRFGPRRLMLIGIPLLGIGFVVMSFINAAWMFYVVGVLAGLGFGVALFIAPHTITSLF